MDKRLEAYLAWLQDRGLTIPPIQAVADRKNTNATHAALEPELAELLARIVSHCFQEYKHSIEHSDEEQITKLHLTGHQTQQAVICFTEHLEQVQKQLNDSSGDERAFFAPSLKDILHNTNSKKSSWITIQAVQTYLQKQ